MKVIGLTGGIGSGKTTAASILAKLGAVVIDADSIGHQVLDEDREVSPALVNHFGPSILNSGGHIDRRALAGRVFGNPRELAFLNSVVHPVIQRRVESMIREKNLQGCEVLVIEAPLLIEAGWSDMVDEIWVVTAPLETVLKRLEQKGMAREQALERMQSQLTDGQRRVYATATIANNTTLAGLEKKISRLFRNYMCQ